MQAGGLEFESLYLHKKVGTAFAAPTFFVEIIPQTVRKVSARAEKSVHHYRGDYEFSILTGGTFTFKTVSPRSHIGLKNSKAIGQDFTAMYNECFYPTMG